jgi:thiol-disulfide isomerase/thioredoxin
MKSSNLVTLLLLLLLASGLPARGANEAEAPDAPQQPAPAEDELAVTEEVAQLLERIGVLPFSGEVSIDNFVRPALAVETRSLDDYAGSIVLVNFWASWCAPCREEMPSMQTLHDSMEGTEFAMLAVNVLESREVAEGFINEFGFTFPVLLDRDGGLSRAFGVRGYPSTYILNARGNIIGMKLGFHDWGTDDVIAAVQELVALETGGE